MLVKFTLKGSAGPISISPAHVVALVPDAGGTVIVCEGNRNGAPLTYTVTEAHSQVESAVNKYRR